MSFNSVVPNFREHLARQLDFLEASAAAYDTGFRDESYRIAVAIRVLIHDTAQSVSLLHHFGNLNAPLLSTTEPASPRAVMYDGLSLFAIGPGSASVRPALDGAPTRRIIPADEWWTEIIYVQNETKLSRRSIVLAAANQDGGAHVDAKLNAKYAEFKQASWTFVSDANAVIDVPEPQLVFLRQMAFELLQSPSLRDLVDIGTITPANLIVTAPSPPWTPPDVSKQDLDAMPRSEVDRLRQVVLKGHFTLLDGLYRSSPGSETNPLGNYQIDQQDGFQGSLEQWLNALLSENLIARGTSFPGLYSATPRGRAFVARVIEIGH